MKQTSIIKRSSTSFLRKSFFSFLIITILITALLTVFLTINYLRTSISMINRFNHELIEHYNYSITYLDETVKKLGNTLYSDKDILQFINMKKNDELVAIVASKVIDRHFLTLKDIESVYLYNTGLDVIYSSRTGERQSVSTFSDQAIVALLTEKKFVAEYSGRPIVTSVEEATQSADTCSYILFEPGVTSSGLKNAIVVNIRTKALTDSIQAINGNDPETKSSFLVVDTNGSILSKTFTPEFEKNMSEVRALSQEAHELERSNNQIRKIGGISYLVSSSKSNANNWYIMGLTPVKETFKEVIKSSFMSVGIVVVIFIICAVICLYLARRLNYPIQTITKIINGEAPEKNDAVVSGMEEFNYILSVFESMKEKNQQLDKIIHEAGYAVKEDFLNALLSDSTTHTKDKVLEKLHDINLDYIATSQLCMCLIKIDNYSQFVSVNSQKERWALRYAIVNIATELAGDYGVCEIFSSEPDKFVVLMDCFTVTQYKVLQEKVERYLREVQSNTLKYLRISLSMAYSTMFQGLEHLPSMYNNMKGSILLKMRYGHGSIITPYMMDEINTDNFHISIKKEEQLVEKVLEGNYESAAAIYQTISPMLYQYMYDEIVYCIVHLIYSIYSNVLSKMPAVKDSQDLTLQQFLRGIQNAEVSTDIDSVMDAFLQKLSYKVGAIRNTSNSNDHLILRIIGIVNQEYSNTELCLSFIAEKLRLSSNYIGQIFKTAHGQSIAQYIFDTRMQKLDEYMRNTQLPLTSVIDKVGLEKNNYFYTRFKKHFGMSLSEYRLQLGQEIDNENDMTV
ncbi:YesN/AraC family two-component response regulator [Paenibacillus castaneae]|uniref:AraC family transcriptional regulator n=1 Tax=Paenibacillus castaneae TaxID=474957 RepID=UPI000C9C0EA5|nr:AraC family transcriptional regulator [Paenibacillus castaneae]NIK78731.1 YesN/AraC family two-component response regulator [Paenibacillus castaneae]